MKNKEKFKKCIVLRKQGLSYSEIRKIVPVAKSTLQNWLTFAGLTLTKEHLEIQTKKRLEKQESATLASQITRGKKKDYEIQNFIMNTKDFLSDPLFVGGVLLYEAEGAKGNACRFSNSDYRVILAFINFLKRYLNLNISNINLRLYIHENRRSDLKRIINYWSKQLGVSYNKFRISWKHNVVTKRRFNSNYVGQIEVRVVKSPYLSRKLLALSDIILSKYRKLL